MYLTVSCGNPSTWITDTSVVDQKSVSGSCIWSCPVVNDRDSWGMILKEEIRSLSLFLLAVSITLLDFKKKEKKQIFKKTDFLKKRKETEKKNLTKYIKSGRVKKL